MIEFHHNKFCACMGRGARRTRAGLKRKAVGTKGNYSVMGTEGKRGLNEDVECDGWLGYRGTGES